MDIILQILDAVYDTSGLHFVAGHVEALRLTRIVAAVQEVRQPRVISGLKGG